MAKHPVMQKAVAVWLLDNTALTFDQIAAFCGLDSLQVSAMADGEVDSHLAPENPILTGELTQDEINRAQEDPAYRMVLNVTDLPKPSDRTKGPRYTPISKRGDKPDGIAYLIKHHPELSDAQIIRLIGTTKNTINAIRDRSHANISNIKPQNPAELGLCKKVDLDLALEKAAKKTAKSEPAADNETKEDLATNKIASQ